MTVESVQDEAPHLVTRGSTAAPPRDRVHDVKSARSDG